jgi:hypothetical protein
MQVFWLVHLCPIAAQLLYIHKHLFNPQESSKAFYAKIPFILLQVNLEAVIDPKDCC